VNKLDFLCSRVAVIFFLLVIFFLFLGFLDTTINKTTHMLTPEEASKLSASNIELLRASIPQHIQEAICTAAEGGHCEARVVLDPNTTIVSDLRALGYHVTPTYRGSFDEGLQYSVAWVSNQLLERLMVMTSFVPDPIGPTPTKPSEQ
jgi:hypothetical protein